MPIQSSYIESITNHGDHFRCRLCYIFDNGRKIIIGPFNVSDQADADYKLLTLKSSILSNIQKQDSNEAINKELNSAYKEATQAMVRKAWLLQGLDQDTLYKTYQFMKNIAPLFVTMNNQDIANTLNISIEQVDKIKSKWLYLSNNSEVIESYINIENGWSKV